MYGGVRKGSMGGLLYKFCVKGINQPQATQKMGNFHPANERLLNMKKFFRKLEHIMEIGGIKKDLVLLAVSAVCVILSLFGLTPKAFDIAWIAVVLCGLPIVLGAVAGLITEFDIRADVLVSIALIASICIGEIFAAGEVAVIMQIGSLLEELTVSRARAGIEKLIDLTPQTARVITDGNEHIVKA